jgi:hypothetical protein
MAAAFGDDGKQKNFGGELHVVGDPSSSHNTFTNEVPLRLQLSAHWLPAPERS